MLNPASLPAVGIFQDPRRVGIKPLEQTCSGGGTGRGADVALLERDSFANQAVQVGRVDVRVAERGNGVVMLLVRDDEDDVRAIHGSFRVLGSECCLWGKSISAGVMGSRGGEVDGGFGRLSGAAGIGALSPGPR